MAEITICSDFGAPEIKSATLSTVSPSICHGIHSFFSFPPHIGHVHIWDLPDGDSGNKFIS